MALTRNYKEGSIIYFKGDLGKEMYILKHGLVTLTDNGLTGTELNVESLKEGDFFGVKSALGSFRREETAEVKIDSVVIVLNLSEFEIMVSKNITLVLNMLKRFSTQLRLIGKEAEKLLSRTGEEYTNEVSLFKLGEHYMRVGNFEGAQYALHKYIEHYPKAENVYEAHKYIDMALRSQPLSGDTQKLGEAKEDNKNIKREELCDLGLDALDAKKYSNAIEYFEKLEGLEPGVNRSDAIGLKARYNKIYCYYELGEYEKVLSQYTDFVRDNKKSSYVKNALYYIGLSYKELGEKDKAKSFLEKVSSLGTDELSKKAKKLINEL